jgi:competence ComEA-like helix-hairpin-helix protein
MLNLKFIFCTLLSFTLFFVSPFVKADFFNKKSKVAASKGTIYEEKKDEQTAIVDLNAADIETLMTLKGIGEKKAENLLKAREMKGKFKSKKDLENIKGFSEKSIKQLFEENAGRIAIKTESIK